MGVSLGRAALVGLSAAVMVFSVAAGAQSPVTTFTPTDEQAEDLPAGPGREETFYACTACHNFKLVAAQGMSRAQWDDTLSWMTSRHGMPDIQGGTGRSGCLFWRHSLRV
jgi:hypothetical protein